MGLASEQVGGALEWNRYFQADIQALRDSSAKRQSQLQALFDQFRPPHPLDATLTSPNESMSGNVPKNSASESGKN